MRSGIALLGFGVVIVRIRLLRPPLAPQPPGNGWRLGLAFTLVGLLMVVLSAFHYFGVRNDIEDDTYDPPDRWVLLATLVLLALGSCVVYYVFQVPFDPALQVLVD
jgi:putative membrane protein